MRQQVSGGGQRRTGSLVGAELGESGLLDHAVLNHQIAEILDGLQGDTALAQRMEQDLEDFAAYVHRQDVANAARSVTSLLSLELDDLRKAALLSLMVRLAGKRKFDPVASYILKHRTLYVTGPA
ncbi:MAG TPA: hypothetical protein VMH80_07440 [Bryobacteraceae bacterium]|nr:hypothetical protein [Bryobacteraceae bacterium]